MTTLHDFLSHPIETLEKALHIRKQIAALEAGLKGLFGPTPVSLAGVQTTVPDGKVKRTMSAAAKAKIANAQRLRWAKSKGLESATLAGAVEISPVPKAKKKGGMSPEGKARIAAAQKARWAKVRGEKSASATVVKAKKSGFSEEHRAKLKAAARARWAKVKNGK